MKREERKQTRERRGKESSHPRPPHQVPLRTTFNRRNPVFLDASKVTLTSSLVKVCSFESHYHHDHRPHLQSVHLFMCRTVHLLSAKSSIDSSATSSVYSCAKPSIYSCAKPSIYATSTDPHDKRWNWTCDRPHCRRTCDRCIYPFHVTVSYLCSKRELRWTLSFHSLKSCVLLGRECTALKSFSLARSSRYVLIQNPTPKIPHP